MPSRDSIACLVSTSSSSKSLPLDVAHPRREVPDLPHVERREQSSAELFEVEPLAVVMALQRPTEQVEPVDVHDRVRTRP